MLFTFYQSSLSQNLWLVTTVCHTHTSTQELWQMISVICVWWHGDDNDGGDTMWCFGVWNKSVFHPPHCQVCMMENTNFASLQSLLLSLALHSATPFGPLRLAIAGPIWHVYDSFVYPLVHIRAYCSQGDSFSAGVRFILAPWFVTFLSYQLTWVTQIPFCFLSWWHLQAMLGGVPKGQSFLCFRLQLIHTTPSPT